MKYHIPHLWQCWICFMQPTHKLWALWLNFRCKCSIFYQDMIIQKCTYVIKLHMEMTYWKQCNMSKLLRWTSNLKQKFSLQKTCKSRLLQSYRTIEKILCILALTVNPFVFALNVESKSILWIILPLKFVLFCQRAANCWPVWQGHQLNFYTERKCGRGKPQGPDSSYLP